MTPSILRQVGAIILYGAGLAALCVVLFILAVANCLLRNGLQWGSRRFSTT